MLWKNKNIDGFSLAALKCICKECAKDIAEKNRKEKIINEEERYIIDKIKKSISRVGIFSSILKCSENLFYEWFKFQSRDVFGKNLDHVIPIYFFRKFSPPSEYLSVRDSWINMCPIDETENLRRGTKVDFSLFEEQLRKAKEFIDKYDYYCEHKDYKSDTIIYYEQTKSLYKSLNKWLE